MISSNCQLMLDMIAAEDKSNPLSDEQLAEAISCSNSTIKRWRSDRHILCASSRRVVPDEPSEKPSGPTQEELRASLRTLIEHEDKMYPLIDYDLADKLRISWEHVTVLRYLEKIPNAPQRRLRGVYRVRG